MRAQKTDGQTDATKCIISLASRSIMTNDPSKVMIFAALETVYLKDVLHR